MTIKEAQDKCFECSKSKGWWDYVNIPEKLALIHSEVTEALEDYRNWNNDHFGEELADIVIRTFDLAAYLGFNMEEEISKKMKINLERPFRHGGKRC